MAALRPLFIAPSAASPQTRRPCLRNASTPRRPPLPGSQPKPASSPGRVCRMSAAEPRAGALGASPQRVDDGTPAAGNTGAAGSHPGLWQALKTCVGKDLSRISLPVWFNEPLSFLQRTAEDLEYSSLLDSAAACGDPAQRAALVGAFVVSHYSSTTARSSKPFNPLLGETFEMVSPQRGVAFVAEQVSHHPPATALHAQGGSWVYYTTHVIHNRFHGNSLEVWPEGAVHILLEEHGEHFVYEQAHTTVHNIVVGNLWLDNSGDINIKEVNRGQVSVSLRFKRYAYLFGEAKTLGDVVGSVTCNAKADSATGSSAKKATKTLKLKLSGNWTKNLKCDGKELWRVSPRPPEAHTAGHNMTAWGWSLNAPPSSAAPHMLPPTDSRLRPDQRALEDGDLDKATSEKNRVEQKQRASRAAMAQRGESHTPQWFERRRGADGLKVSLAFALRLAAAHAPLAISVHSAIPTRSSIVIFRASLSHPRLLSIFFHRFSLELAGMAL